MALRWKHSSGTTKTELAKTGATTRRWRASMLQFQVFHAIHQLLVGLGWSAGEGRLLAVEHRDRHLLTDRHGSHRVIFCSELVMAILVSTRCAIRGIRP